MKNAVKYRQPNVPRQQGELARLKVVQGPDIGCVFIVRGAKVTMGRGEDNDIVLTDLKTSRRHAELAAGPGGWTLRDNGSANGISFKGKAVRSTPLRGGDFWSIGQTTFEFISADQGTQVIMAPARTREELDAQERAFQEQRKRVLGVASVSSTSVAGADGQKSKRPLLLGGIGLLVVVFFLLPSGPSDKKPKKKKAEPNREVAALVNQEDIGGGKNAAMFFSLGFREFREKNYLRAKEHFETVLQMAPGHIKAVRYMALCDQEIKRTVEDYLKAGKKSLDAGRFREAQGNYKAIHRLLYRDTTHPAYIEAKDQLDKVEKAMGEGGG